MDDLPDEIIVMILKNYSYLSEFFSWRLVSKRFRFLIDNHTKLKELIINRKLSTIKSPHSPRHRSAPLTYVKETPIHNRNTIQLELFNPSDSSSFQTLCSNLRYLKIGILFCLTKTSIQALNGLTKLEELVSEAVSMGDDSPAELSLPNLKVLSIGSVLSCKLKINSKLEKFYCGLNFYKQFASRFQIELNHPEHLIYLETDHGVPDQVISFKNLRTLRFRPISLRDIKRVLKIESLQEIYFKFDELNIGNLIDYSMDQKEVLNRQDLKIYFANILITRPFRTYGFANLRSPRYLLITNFDALLARYYRSLPDCLPDHRAILGFSSMFCVLNKRKLVFDPKTSLPKCFFRKFLNVQFICIEDSQNQSKLVEVLGEFKHLNSLKIEKTCEFTQSIIDKLPKLCPQLKAFEVTERRNEDETELVRLNYGPICELKYLWNLNLCTDLKTLQDLQFMLDLFKGSRYLAECYLRVRKEYNVSKPHCTIRVKRQALHLFSTQYFGAEKNLFKGNMEFDELRIFVHFLGIFSILYEFSNVKSF